MWGRYHEGCGLLPNASMGKRAPTVGKRAQTCMSLISDLLVQRCYGS